MNNKYYRYRLFNNPTGKDKMGKWNDFVLVRYPNSNDDVEFEIALYAYMKDGELTDAITNLPLLPYGFLEDDLKNYKRKASWLAITELVPVSKEVALEQIDKVKSNSYLEYCYFQYMKSVYNYPMTKYNESDVRRRK